MLAGWRVFMYSRELHDSLKDGLSYCNTPISRYSQSIFKSTPQNMLEIYNTPANTIEAFVDAGILEIRLLAWDRSATYCIILEKIKIDLLHYGFVEDRAVKFASHGKIFNLRFYNRDDLDEFIRNIKIDKQYARFSMEHAQNSIIKCDNRNAESIERDDSGRGKIKSNKRDGNANKEVKFKGDNQEYLKAFIEQMKAAGDKHKLNRHFMLKTESIDHFVYLMANFTRKEV